MAEAKTQQNKNIAINLTEGPILSNMVRFAAPLLVGKLLQTLYNSVDSIVVGRWAPMPWRR